MVIQDRFIVGLASLLAFAAVALGAFGAHGLQKKDFGDKAIVDSQGQVLAGLKNYEPIKAKRIANFEVATRYQMFHALALLFLGLVGAPRSIAWLFVSGIVLFSGSLYLLVLTGVTKLGMVTPIGGVLFLVSWMRLFLWNWKSRSV